MDWRQLLKGFALGGLGIVYDRTPGELIQPSPEDLADLRQWLLSVSKEIAASRRQDFALDPNSYDDVKDTRYYKIANQRGLILSYGRFDLCITWQHIVVTDEGRRFLASHVLAA